MKIVKMVNKEKHLEDPQFYPKAGTFGIVVFDDEECSTIMVQWKNGSTSKDDKWYCNKKDIKEVANCGR